MKTKLIFALACLLSVLNAGGSLSFAETDMSDNPVADPTFSSHYQPSPEQMTAVVGLIRQKTVKDFEVGAAKAQKTQSEDAATVRQEGAKKSVEMEKFYKLVDKTAGGQVPDEAFSQAATLVIQKDYDHLNTLYKGKLDPDTLRLYIGCIDLAYTMSHYADKNGVIHISDEKLTEMKASGKSDFSYSEDERQVAAEVFKNALAEEEDYLEGKGNPTPTADTDPDHDNSRPYVVARWLWQNYGQKDEEKDRQNVKGPGNQQQGNPFSVSNDTIFHGFYLADYRMLTQGKDELAKKKFADAQLLLEGRINEFYSSYSGYVVLKSFQNMNQIQIDMGKVLEDAAVGAAKDIGTNAVKNLLGF